MLVLFDLLVACILQMGWTNKILNLGLLIYQALLRDVHPLELGLKLSVRHLDDECFGCEVVLLNVLDTDS